MRIFPRYPHFLSVILLLIAGVMGWFTISIKHFELFCSALPSSVPMSYWSLHFLNSFFRKYVLIDNKQIGYTQYFSSKIYYQVLLWYSVLFWTGFRPFMFCPLVWYLSYLQVHCIWCSYKTNVLSINIYMTSGNLRSCRWIGQTTSRIQMLYLPVFR
jgi:hypothetical protein